MQCHFCEQEKPGLPFRCNYCGNYFCADHRLPENHACARVGGPKQPGYSNLPSIQERYAKARSRVGNIPGVTSGRSRFRLGYPSLFSKTERKHILIATALVTLVGLSMELSLFIHFDGAAILFSIFGFLAAFLGHELAHKFFAQRNGLWAEFRTNPYGLIFTVISAIPISPFKFIAPGHVNVIGQPNKELSGAIALIGPGFNILFGVFMLLLAVVMEGILGATNFAFAARTVSLFNGYMALFNLIPFMGFDGLAAFEWDKTRWVIALVGAIGLTIAALVLV